ncbi:MAG: hypothetical protein ABIT83_17530 [Massilia sp.]
MKIKMTTTVQGSLDGRTVRELVRGEEYETVDSPRGDRLAAYHVKRGVAVAAVADVPAAVMVRPQVKQKARKR